MKMNNRDYINIYKDEKRIISDFYKVRDKMGKMVQLDGIVNPLKLDNRQKMAPTDNQEDSPHCASYSALTVVESLYWKMTGKLLQLDAHQNYALAKQLDGDIDGEGTYLECALQAILNLTKDKEGFEFLKDAKIGLFYNDKSQNLIETVKYLVKKYDIVQVGFNIDDAWYNCTNQNYILRKGYRQLGGHAVNIVGWDNVGFYVLNQWGTNWGAKGYCVMPYQLFLDELMYGAYLYNINY